MLCRLWPAAICLVLTLGACSAPERPFGAVCKGICPKTEGPIALMRGPADPAASTEAASPTDAMADTELREQIRALMRKKVEAVPAGIPERALADLPLIEDGRLRLLALSSGGPFGAFGAGFLNGWSAQTTDDLVRPEAFDVVTGVSAGALLATFAFLGPDRDGDLETAYTTISTENVFRQRPPFKALFSNSFFDTSPLRATLKGLVTADLLDQVAEATAPDPADGVPPRFLLVLAVDLDSGLPRILDLGAIARDRSDPDRIDNYIDALMASSAIPVAFPPIFIDGAMHVDGGARLALFFNRFMEDQRALVDGRDVPPAKLDIIVNAEVTVEPACADNRLIGIGQRSVDVVLNQLTLDGLYRTISEAERDGIDVRYVTAEGSGCADPDDPADPFERRFLQCLFAFGQKLGSSATPFKTGLDDFPELAVGASYSATRSCPSG
jgi:predicted acylesterase/phospholipase RssA